LKTKLSSKGQVVLPVSARRVLGLEAGELLDVVVEGERVILSRSPVTKPKVTFGFDPVTGLPVLTAVPGSPKLTGEQVAEILADFP
jgi:AbrB family looped-hinge helix DNA binding protein